MACQGCCGLSCGGSSPGLWPDHLWSHLLPHVELHHLATSSSSSSPSSASAEAPTSFCGNEATQVSLPVYNTHCKDFWTITWGEGEHETVMSCTTKLHGAIAIASVSLVSSPSVEVGPGSPSRTAWAPHPEIPPGCHPPAKTVSALCSLGWLVAEVWLAFRSLPCLQPGQLRGADGTPEIKETNS